MVTYVLTTTLKVAKISFPATTGAISIKGGMGGVAMGIGGPLSRLQTRRTTVRRRRRLRRRRGVPRRSLSPLILSGSNDIIPTSRTS